MKTLKTMTLLAGLGLTGFTQAEILWDNGAHDNSGNGVNNQYQSVMDDFYVSGAGWFVNSVETQGIFLNPGRVVSDVDITIWPSNPVTGEPDGDNAFNVATTSFEAVDSGQNWEGYDKINVTADFTNTYLEGQEIYFIELDIKDQFGQRIKLIERQNVQYLPAHIGPGAYPFDSGVDLAYKLSGTQVKMLSFGGPKELKIESLDNGLEVVSMHLSGASKSIKPGLFQMKMQRKTPVLYRFDDTGNRQAYDFTPNPRKPAKFTTPLGDDMCENASGSLHDYCQSFVACAAYELWCPGF